MGLLETSGRGVATTSRRGQRPRPPVDHAHWSTRRQGADPGVRPGRSCSPPTPARRLRCR